MYNSYKLLQGDTGTQEIADQNGTILPPVQVTPPLASTITTELVSKQVFRSLCEGINGMRPAAKVRASRSESQHLTWKLSSFHQETLLTHRSWTITPQGTRRARRPGKLHVRSSWTGRMWWRTRPTSGQWPPETLSMILSLTSRNFIVIYMYKNIEN